MRDARTGLVVAFDPVRGLGRIRGPDGTELAFHSTRLADGSRTVEVGADVVYARGPGAAPGSWEATEIVKV